jgi:hypothetical protein
VAAPRQVLVHVASRLRLDANKCESCRAPPSPSARREQERILPGGRF